MSHKFLAKTVLIKQKIYEQLNLVSGHIDSMRIAGLNRKKNNNLKNSVNKRYNFKMLRNYLYPKVSEFRMHCHWKWTCVLNLKKKNSYLYFISTKNGKANFDTFPDIV